MNHGARVEINKKIFEMLFSLKDEKLKLFSAKLIPNLSPNNILGIQMPKLKRLSKELKGNENLEEFFSSLPHTYLEENTLHALLIAQIEDYDKCIFEINRFLPFIDNWATCDALHPKCFKSNKTKLLNEIKTWLKSSHAYTIRFGIGMLMSNFLEEDFKPEIIDLVISINFDDYYVKMMQAWFLSTALVKQYDKTLPYFQNKKIEKWVNNKAIQKAVESFRISNEQKQFLKQLKQK